MCNGLAFRAGHASSDRSAWLDLWRASSASSTSWCPRRPGHARSCTSQAASQAAAVCLTSRLCHSSRAQRRIRPRLARVLAIWAVCARATNSSRVLECRARAECELEPSASSSLRRRRRLGAQDRPLSAPRRLCCGGVSHRRAHARRAHRRLVAALDAGRAGVRAARVLAFGLYLLTKNMRDSGLPADVLHRRLNEDISFLRRRGTLGQVSTAIDVQDARTSAEDEQHA